MARMGGDEPTHQPGRVVTGLCPECGRVCVVFNNHESWPLIKCACEWRGGVDQLEAFTLTVRRSPWTH